MGMSIRAPQSEHSPLISDGKNLKVRRKRTYLIMLIAIVLALSFRLTCVKSSSNPYPSSL